MYILFSVEVRQGSVLAPFFALFVDDLAKLCSLRQSCYIILYADDILLIAASVLELEHLFHPCERELFWLDMAINYKWVRLVNRNFILVCNTN